MDCIPVCIRVRPLNTKERESGQEECWQVTENTITAMDHLGETSKAQSFDHCFDSSCTTTEVYNQVGHGIVKAAMEGYHGTLFCYGQTSSGKTYTMYGDERNPGVVRLAARDIYSIIESTPEREYLLKASMVEIYNENVNDLLGKKPAKVREDYEGRILLEAEKKAVSTPEDVLSFLQEGERSAQRCATKMNETSSRSHTIFRLYIESRLRTAEGEDEEGFALQSSLNLVDLAGSECAAQTGAEGQTRREGACINKSLLALSSVIEKLSTPGMKDSYIPFRNSVLTRILQGSLGGNAKTAIICNVTPASAHFQQTLSTLAFASRAKKVKNTASVNKVTDDKTELKRCKKEINELRAQLNQLNEIESGQERVKELEREKELLSQKLEMATKMICVSRRPRSKKEKGNRRMTMGCPIRSVSAFVSPIRRQTFNFMSPARVEDLTKLTSMSPPPMQPSFTPEQESKKRKFMPSSSANVQRRLGITKDVGVQCMNIDEQESLRKHLVQLEEENNILSQEAQQLHTQRMQELDTGCCTHAEDAKRLHEQFSLAHFHGLDKERELQAALAELSNLRAQLQLAQACNRDADVELENAELKQELEHARARARGNETQSLELEQLKAQFVELEGELEAARANCFESRKRQVRTETEVDRLNSIISSKQEDMRDLQQRLNRASAEGLCTVCPVRLRDNQALQAQQLDAEKQHRALREEYLKACYDFTDKAAVQREALREAEEEHRQLEGRLQEEVTARQQQSEAHGRVLGERDGEVKRLEKLAAELQEQLVHSASTADSATETQASLALAQNQLVEETKARAALQTLHQNKVEQLESLISELRAKVSDSRSEVSLLEEKLAKAEGQADEVDRELISRKHDELQREHQKEVQALEEVATELRARLAEAESVASSLRERLSEAEDKLSQADSAIAHKQTLLDSQEKAHTQELAQERARMEAHEKTHAEELAQEQAKFESSVSEQVSELQKQLESVTAELAMHTQKATELQEELDSARQQNSIVMKELTHRDPRKIPVEKMREDLSQALKQNTALKNELSMKDRKLRSLDKIMDGATKEQQKQVLRIKSMEEKLKEVKGEKSAADKEMSKREAEVKELRRKIERLEKEAERHARTIEGWEQKLKAVQEQLKEKEEQNVAGSKMLSEVIVQKQTLQEQVAAQKNQLEKLQAEIVNLREASESKDVQLQQGAERLKEVTQQGESLTEKLATLSAQHEALQGDKVDTDAILERVSTEVHDLRGVRAGLEAQVDSLSRDLESITHEKSKLQLTIPDLLENHARAGLLCERETDLAKLLSGALVEVREAIVFKEQDLADVNTLQSHLQAEKVGMEEKLAQLTLQGTEAAEELKQALARVLELETDRDAWQLERGDLTTRAQTLEKKLEAATQESIGLSQELETMGSELKRASDETSQAQQDLSEKDMSVKALHAEIEELSAQWRTDTQKYTAEFAAKEKTLAEKSAETQFLTEELESIRSQIEEEKKSRAEVEQKLLASETCLKEAGATVAQRTADAVDAKSLVNKLNEQLKLLQEAAQKKDNRITELQTEVFAAQEKLDKASKQLRDRSLSSEVELTGLQTTCLEKDSTIKELKAEVEDLQGQLRDRIEELYAKSREKEEVQHELEMKKADLDEKETCMQELQTLMADAEERRSEADGLGQALQQKLKALQQYVDEKDGETKRRDEQIENLSGKMCQEGLKNAEEKQTLASRTTELQGETEALQTVLTGKAQRISQLELEIQVLESEHAEAKQDWQSERRKLTWKLENLQQLTAEPSAHVHDQGGEVTIESLRVEINSLSSSLRTAKNELAATKQSVAMKDRELQSIRSDVDKWQKECLEAKNKVSVAQRTMESEKRRTTLRIKASEDAVAMLKGQLTNTELESQSEKMAVRRQTMHCSNAETGLKKVQEELFSTLKELDETKKALAQAQQDSQSIADLQEECNHYKSEVAMLEETQRTQMIKADQDTEEWKAKVQKQKKKYETQIRHWEERYNLLKHKAQSQLEKYRCPSASRKSLAALADSHRSQSVGKENVVIGAGEVFHAQVEELNLLEGKRRRPEKRPLAARSVSNDSSSPKRAKLVPNSQPSPSVSTR